MKFLRRLSIIMVMILLMSALVAVMPAYASSPSDWAVPEIAEANMQQLLTPSAQRDYKRHLTREEYCELVVEMVEQLRGSQLPIPSRNKFVDTSSIHVLKAEAYGIVNGTTDTTFSPDATVQRQQICAMMIRAINGLENEFNRALLESPAQSLPFTDVDQIAEYALLPAQYAYSNGIMEGNANNTLTPRNSITSEECVAIIIRSFRRIDNALAQRRTTTNHLDTIERRLSIGFSFGDCEFGLTRNIQLPTIGSGGAVITWSSSDTGIIAIGSAIYNGNSVEIGRSGVVNIGSNSRSVTLTATITLNNITRTREFTLRTSTLTGDQLRLENAYNMLDIIYFNADDSADNVTGRIGLRDKILDFPVTWRTSDANVVTTRGEVTIPSGYDMEQVTLTATIGSGSMTRTKTFHLTVVNPSYNRGARLHGIELGTSPSRVTQTLGTVRKTIQTNNGETWHLYHNNYDGFVAVAYISNRAVAVYSMAANVANQLRNNAGSVIAVDQANLVNGLTAVAYNDSSQQYAIMIYETNSDIGSRRSLTAESQEEFLFELVNAYRVRNNRATLEWSDKLRAPARTHSEWLRGNAPSNGTGSNSITARAENAGFYTSGNRPRFGGGNALAGENDAIAYLQEIVVNGDMRSGLISRDNTLFGAGYASTNTGTYRSYMTYMLGQARFITAVTANPSTGNPATIQVPGIGLGSTQTITLNLTYTSLISGNSYNEPYAVTSSNTGRMTVAAGSGANAYVLTGVSTGTVNLVVTGSLSGKSYEIPVNVAAGGMATNLQLTYPATETIPVTNLIANNQTSSSRTSTYTIIVGEYESLSLAATATMAANSTAPVITWTRSDTEAVVTGNHFTMNGRAAGALTVKAAVQTSSGTIEHTVNIRVVGVSLSTNALELELNTQAPQTTISTESGSAPPIGPSSYLWSPTSGTVAWVSSGEESASAIISSAASIQGTQATATITGAMIWNAGQGGIHYIGVARRAIAVTVKNATVYILPPKATFHPGEKQNLSVNFTQMQGHTVEWRVVNGASIDISNGFENHWVCQIEAVDAGDTRIAVEVRNDGGELVGSHELVVSSAWPALNITAPQELLDSQDAVFAWADDSLSQSGYSVEWICLSAKGVTDPPGAEFELPGGNDSIASGETVTVTGLAQNDVVTITAELYFDGTPIPVTNGVKWVSSTYIVKP